MAQNDRKLCGLNHLWSASTEKCCRIGRTQDEEIYKFSRGARFARTSLRIRRLRACCCSLY